jgi:HK97 gp10 family phage protein
MAAVGVSITGVKEIDRALMEFERKAKNKAIRTAAREAARDVQREAVILAPHHTGALERAIRVRGAKKRAGRGRDVIGASIVVGEGFFAGDTFYAGFLEFGTRERFHQSGKSTGRIEPGVFDFLRQALFTNTQRVLQTFRRALIRIVVNTRGKR